MIIISKFTKALIIRKKSSRDASARALIIRKGNPFPKAANEVLEMHSWPTLPLPESQNAYNIINKSQPYMATGLL